MPIRALCMMVIVGIVGCNRPIEIKQDTPQETVATLIRLYGGEHPERASQLMDPLLFKLYGAEDQCLDATLADQKCIDEMLQASIRNSYTRVECKSDNFQKCACSQETQNAVTQTKDYSRSWLHEGLVAAGLSKDECKLLDVQAAPELSKVTSASTKGLCGVDVTGDEFTNVRFSCGTKDKLRFTLGLRKKKGTAEWKVVGLDSDTRILLWSSDMAADMDKAEKRKDQKRKELNSALE